MDMKTTFFKKLAALGMCAALAFTLPSCNEGREAADEDSLAEDGAITGMEDEELESDYYELEQEQVRDQDWYRAWDADRNGALDEEEFRENWYDDMGEETYTETAFSDWDANKDANLDENEFRGGMWAYYDSDKNNSLNKEEFKRMSSRASKNWDQDNNQGISQEEFQKGWQQNMGNREYNAGLFEEWDADNNDLLDENELNEGLFDVWDENNNDTIEQEELQMQQS